MQSRAFVVNEPLGPFVDTVVELDEPRDDEIVVRIVATGLCHTDLTMREMLPAEMFPRILGHEGAGIVEAIGPNVTGVEVGDHVILSHRSCRTCNACKDGRVGYCDNTLMLNYMGFRLDGSTTHSVDGAPVQASFFGQSSLSSHAITYPDNTIVVDPSLDLTMLAPFGCGFQTGAGTVLHKLKPTAGQSLAVFGTGAVGLAALQAARSLGLTRLVAIDPVASRRALAADLGALTLDQASEDTAPLSEQVKALTDGGVDFAIDTTAKADVVLSAQRALRSGGTLVALGLGAAEYTVDAIDLLQGGKTVTSCVEGDVDPLQFIPYMIDLRAGGLLDTDAYIRTYPADRIDDAVADMLAGRVVKPVLVW